MWLVLPYWKAQVCCDSFHILFCSQPTLLILSPHFSPRVSFLKATNGYALSSLVIIVLSFVMVMTVFGRFFRLYLFTALSPIALSTFAGEPTQSTGVSFLKSYAGVCLEGAVIALSCLMFSVYASAPIGFEGEISALAMVLSYMLATILNMLMLVGTVKGAVRVVREMIG